MDAKYFVKFNCTIFKSNFREIHIFIETRTVRVLVFGVSRADFKSIFDDLT